MEEDLDSLLCKCFFFGGGKCEQAVQELSIKRVSKPAIYYKSRIFHSFTVTEKNFSV